MSAFQPYPMPAPAQRPVLFLDSLHYRHVAQPLLERTTGMERTGRRFSTMCSPKWQAMGSGLVRELAPPVASFQSITGALMNLGRQTIKFPEFMRHARTYRADLEESFYFWQEDMAPGKLEALAVIKQDADGNPTDDYKQWRFGALEEPTIRHGDELFCNCQRPSRRKNKGLFCHLQVATPYLYAAGWRVVLYGEEWTPEIQAARNEKKKKTRRQRK